MSEGQRGSARVGEGRAKSSSFSYINHERFFDIHRSVSPLFKGGGLLVVAQDGRLDFLSKIQLSKKVGN